MPNYSQPTHTRRLSRVLSLENTLPLYIGLPKDIMGQHSRLLPQAKMLKPSNSSFMQKTRPLRNRLAEKIEWVKLRTPKVVKSRAFRRAATITSAVFFALSFIIILAKLTNAGFFIPKLVSHISRYPTCQSKGINGTRDIWEASQKKYENLMDDKFTYVSESLSELIFRMLTMIVFQNCYANVSSTEGAPRNA